MNQEIILHPLYTDFFSSWRSELEDRIRETAFTHYASHLLNDAIPDETELEKALQKALHALVAVKMPVTNHFKAVYICSKGQLKKDYLVTDLGLRLILLNTDTANPIVARLQVEILTNSLF